ncbi:hypothetical protein GCM10010472_64650 [Pseudonocardia halophobica]|uniref:Dienelactone hydrolase domain-containing protein n=1 Tax=Pseudonocardia halophobica TaxID=29401 RepID=A0A9W6P0K3_9PSEU|nr:dienelactone hydrolase family protein [Pseudonocardia halophobica]GLL15535.1 hypothetical protein GCM10017577_66860 [Pseudonocardia halophobica]
MGHEAMPRVEPETLDLDGVAVAALELGASARGAVVLLQERAAARGETAERLNLVVERGYCTLAVPHEGVGVALPAARRRLAAAGWGPEQTGVVGIGASAGAALALAGQGEVGGVVLLAPDDLEPTALAAVAVPTLVVLGGRTLGLTAAQVAALDAAGRRASELVRVVVEPEVGHGFVARSGETAGHAAWFDTWQRTVEWFDLLVSPRATPLALAWDRRHDLSTRS